MNFLEADTQSPLRFAMTDARELASLERDFIADMFESRITGILIRAAFPAATVARVVERLESGACGHVERASKYWRGRAIGPSLQYAVPDLRDYFAEVSGFHSDCAALFKGGPDFQTRSEELLAHARAGRPLSALRGPRGEMYGTTTIRGLVPGSTMHPHCDIEQFKLPAVRHLASHLDASAMLSYLLQLATPEAGGELHVYGVRYDDEPGETFARMEFSTEESMRAIAAYGELVVPMAPGDVLLFNAGHYFHQVDPVVGSRTRWTQGGFLSRSYDGGSVYCWH